MSVSVSFHEERGSTRETAAAAKIRILDGSKRYAVLSIALAGDDATFFIHSTAAADTLADDLIEAAEVLRTLN